jgi:hypothetical protein
MLQDWRCVAAREPVKNQVRDLKVEPALPPGSQREVITAARGAPVVGPGAGPPARRAWDSAA